MQSREADVNCSVPPFQPRMFLFLSPHVPGQSAGLYQHWLIPDVISLERHQSYMSVKRPHDELLSSTTPLALQSVVEMRSKRPRATDLLSPNDAHTYNSAEVRTQLENGWMLNRAAQKVIANLRASLAPEDVKSRICTEGLYLKQNSSELSKLISSCSQSCQLPSPAFPSLTVTHIMASLWMQLKRYTDSFRPF